ncbi:hypothetical protein Pla163_19690 [Planctomycetes bacterium Pla163]|uniref:Uncharacterized protein n=1 Tax=Rohdeia mirabilis TaxID=2528008 RepID=A0A518D045_9BACT|nr:hypothetical protein Pla163_19690 [Planctomycetes bacterium Pla163]
MAPRSSLAQRTSGGGADGLAGASRAVPLPRRPHHASVAYPLARAQAPPSGGLVASSPPARS